MVRLKIFAPKLIDLKAALVHVEMDVALLKIRRAGLPNLGFGMQSLHRLPSAVADAFCVFLGRNEQDLQLVVMGFSVDLQNHAANSFSVDNDAVGLAVGRIDTMLDRFARDDLPVKIKMVYVPDIRTGIDICALMMRCTSFAQSFGRNSL